MCASLASLTQNHTNPTTQNEQDCPTISFYAGTFTDGTMTAIEGVIQRNRDIGVPKEGQPHVVVNVGKFRMEKVADYQV